MMRIAFLGTRGIPARYGGFETCAEELSRRLVERGHQVTVYGRLGHYPERLKEYCGVRLVYLPEIKMNFLETLSHTFFSLLHCAARPFDALLVFNSANSPFLFIPRLAGQKAVLHMDGLEWKRGKWSALGKRYFKFAERLAARGKTALISDSAEIWKYYRTVYRRNTHLIAYGGAILYSENPALLAPLGLEAGDYFLQITRFEPENNPLLTVRAFEILDTSKKLVIVGGNRYRTPYAEEIAATRDPRIRLPGFLYEKDLLRELLTNCFAYIHGNEVGGTNPALLEAMGTGCFVISRDVPFNREILCDAGVFFQKDATDLRDKMEWALRHAGSLKEKGEKAREIIRKNFTWDTVVDEYERLFLNLTRGKAER